MTTLTCFNVDEDNVMTLFDVVYLEMTSTPRRALFARMVTYIFHQRSKQPLHSSLTNIKQILSIDFSGEFTLIKLVFLKSYLHVKPLKALLLNAVLSSYIYFLHIFL